MPNINDVARMAGVSKSTVSLAFNHPDRVHSSTLERVRQASIAVGYAADPLARTLARGRSSIIGMIVDDISVPFFSKVLSEFEKSAVAAGYLVIVSDAAGDVERELALLEHYAGLRVAGVALSPTGHGAEYTAQLKQFKMPMVCFDNRVADLNVDFVGSDNRLASSMITEHLIQLGHTRIAFVAGTPEMHTADERLAGYRETVERSGLKLDDSLVAPGRYDGEVAYSEAMKLLTRQDRPTAIITANNIMGFATLQAIQELGFQCPDQISLAMIDDAPWSNVITPKLTAVVQDTAELGRAVARLLLARISGQSELPLPPQQVVLPTKFVSGASCRRI